MNIEDDLNVINPPADNDQQQQQQPKTALKLKKDPFANTHKWNDMLSAFCTQMPLKKHRRNLRAYSNCFAGWEAVDWMLDYLKTSADFKHLTLNRQNAVSILKILCKDKLFEDVRSNASSSVSDHSFNAKPFGDDDRLYRFSEKNAHYSKRHGITTSSISSSSSKKIAVAAAAASSSSTASNSSISISSSATTTRTSSFDQDEMSLRHPQTTMSSLSSTTVELSAEMLSNKKRANKNETVIKEVPSKSGEVETSKRIFQNLNSHHVTNMASYKLGSRVGELSSLVEQNAAESSIEITKYKRISSPKKITGSGQEMTMTTRNSNTIKTTQDENIEPRGVLGVNNMQLVATKLSTLRPQEAEIWSKMLRKSLESTLRRAVLTCNHQNATLWRDQIRGGRECAGRQMESQLKQEPYQSTTLRRSYDIKIGLSKLLDKKAYEILQKAAVSSGPFISHNCNNVNKHGVVTCDKSDDMPDWVIKGMHELINWDTKNTEKGYIAFEDVFQQIVKYYRSLNEPLLTTELSYLFLDVFEFLLFIKDSSNSLFQKSKSSGKSFSTTATSGLKQETSKSASNNTNIKQQSSSCSSLKIIEELIDDLRSQVKEERLKSSKTKDGEESGESSSKSGESSETRVNKIIRLMNESAANKSKTEAKKTIKINENVESKLIEDAFLPVSFLVDNENDDDEDERDLRMSILAELNSLLELHEFNLTNRQKETIMQSLKPYLNQSTTRNNSSSMMSSIHNMTTRSSNVDKLQEFDEFLMEYKLRENGLKMSTTNSALSLTEVTNAYENDEDEIDMEEEEEEEAEDEVDLDDEDENYDVEYEVDYLEDDNDDDEDEEEYVDDLYEACQLRRPPIKKKPMSSVNESDVVSVRSDLVISRRNRNDTMMTSSATTASMMSIDAGFSTIRPNHATTIQNHCNKNYIPNQIPTNSNSGNRVIQKSLSEKRLRRNNSFRAAIERLPTSGLDYNKKTMSKSSTFFSMSSNDNKNRFETNFKDDNSNIEASRVKSIKTKNKEENSGQEKEKDEKVELSDGYKTNKEATAQFKIPYPPAASELRQQPYLVVNHTNPNSNPNPNPNLNPKLNTKKSTNSSQLRPSSASMVSLDAAASSIKRGAFQPMSPPSSYSSSSSSSRALNQEFDSRSNVTCFSDSIPATSSNTVKQKNDLSSQSMESSQVYSMIGAFRLLTLILPPKNRRKLHFLLRFLYKLKNADHTARNLSSVKQQQQTNKQSVLSIQQQVELFILSSFVSSIVAIEQKSSSSSNSNLSDDYQQKLALKLAQLFVDNYSEIMGIPQDFVLSVRQRLTSSLAVAPSTDDDLSSNKTNSDITNNSSAAKTTMTSVDSSNLFDSTTIKFGPHPFFAESSRSLVDFENPKMARKALNILGLNETTTTTTANSASQSHHFTKHQPSSKINFNNTTMFLRSATTSNMNETSQDFSSSSRSSGSSVPNSSKHFLTSSSISFSKFFNKKKKENLI